MGGGVLGGVCGHALVRQMRDVNHDRFALHRSCSSRLSGGNRIGLALYYHRLKELLLRLLFILQVVVVEELSQCCQKSHLELLLLGCFVEAFTRLLFL
jgi:hypothetical protein